MTKLTKSQIRHRQLKEASEMMPEVLERLERLEHHNKLLNAWIVMNKDPCTKLGLVRQVDRYDKVSYVRIESLEFTDNKCIVTPMHPANMSRVPEFAPANTEIRFIYKDFEQHLDCNEFKDRHVNEIRAQR